MDRTEFDEFVDLVKEMRDTQSKYFRTRDANVLNRARDLERKVDNRIKEIEDAKYGNTLF